MNTPADIVVRASSALAAAGLGDLVCGHASVGITGEQHAEVRETSDHATDNGMHTETLVAALDTPDKRRAHISTFFLGGDLKRGGGWTNLAAQGSFDENSAAFQSEPFADASRFRASLGYYEAVINPGRKAETCAASRGQSDRNDHPLRHQRRSARPQVPRRMALALPNLVGPFLIDSGHFIQWEQANTFNNAVVSFCRDLL